MLVAEKVDNCEALGTILGLELVRVKQIKRQYSDPKEVNMKILETWMQQQTRKPTTWRTLLKALQEMNMKKLVDEITKKLKQRPNSYQGMNVHVCNYFFIAHSRFWAERCTKFGLQTANFIAFSYFRLQRTKYDHQLSYNNILHTQQMYKNLSMTV